MAEMEIRGLPESCPSILASRDFQQQESRSSTSLLVDAAPNDFVLYNLAIFSTLANFL